MTSKRQGRQLLRGRNRENRMPLPPRSFFFHRRALASLHVHKHSRCKLVTAVAISIPCTHTCPPSSIPLVAGCAPSTHPSRKQFPYPGRESCCLRKGPGQETRQDQCCHPGAMEDQRPLAASSRSFRGGGTQSPHQVAVGRTNFTLTSLSLPVIAVIPMRWT